MANDKGVLDILNCSSVPFSGYDSPGKKTIQWDLPSIQN